MCKERRGPESRLDVDRTEGLKWAVEMIKREWANINLVDWQILCTSVLRRVHKRQGHIDALVVL